MEAAAIAVIDCDLHNQVPTVQALLPYLPRFWQEYIGNSAFKGPVDTPYPPAAPTSARADYRTADGALPGSCLQHLQQHVLEPWGTDIGILNCAYAIESIHNPDAAAASR
jgi:uncharacterized protein